MGDGTGIAWTDATWNPVRGCSRVSEGCRNCYAERIAARFSGPGKPFEGFAEHPAYSQGTPAACHRPARPRWTGKVALVPEKLDEPLHWRKPRRVFVNSMSDLFHESLPFEDIDLVFAAMAQAPRQTFQVLTKRPQRAREYFSKRDPHLAMTRCFRNFKDYEKPVGPWPLPNVWLGVSAEDQGTLRERAWTLLKTPAAVRFISLEPLLGPVDLNEPELLCDAWRRGGTIGTYLDWVIVGGESGPKARPCDVAWIRRVVEQCRETKTAVFVKQLGARPTGEPWAVNRKFSPLVNSRSGSDPAEWPEDLRVREFPEVRG
jgi:protein gp37